MRSRTAAGRGPILALATLLLGLGTGLAATAGAQVTVEWITEEEADVLIAAAEAIGGGGGTPDGLTPAAEDICTKWGFSGSVKGLCNAYCEAMDCDSEDANASSDA